MGRVLYPKTEPCKRKILKIRLARANLGAKFGPPCFGANSVPHFWGWLQSLSNFRRTLVEKIQKSMSKFLFWEVGGARPEKERRSPFRGLKQSTPKTLLFVDGPRREVRGGVGHVFFQCVKSYLMVLTQMNNFICDLSCIALAQNGLIL